MVVRGELQRLCYGASPLATYRSLRYARERCVLAPLMSVPAHRAQASIDNVGDLCMIC